MFIIIDILSFAITEFSRIIIESMNQEDRVKEVANVMIKNTLH